MDASSRSHTQRSGLTLVEVLVLVALLALALLVFVPHITSRSSLERAKALKAAAQGSGIYKQIFAARVMLSEDDSVSVQYFASSDTEEYNNSTDYFRWLLTEEVLEEDFSMFTGFSLPVADSVEEMKEENNLWSVVADTHVNTAIDTPFLISRNLNEDRLKDWSGDPDMPLENVNTGTYENPSKSEVLIVVRHGGGAEVIQPRQFLWDILNPHAQTNIILNP